MSYQLTNHQIAIAVMPIYQPDLSRPEESHYVWSYEVVLHNHSNRTIQFLRRHWIIIDASGFVTQVVGEGIVGHQPTLEPGQSFQYVSQVQTHTLSGVVCGKYTILWMDTKEECDIEIPAFSLDFPGQRITSN